MKNLALGTATFSNNYGINYESNNLYANNESYSINLITKAINAGIKLIDTSPNYGDAEKFIGKALKITDRQIDVCTKLSIEDQYFLSGKSLAYRFILASVKRSLKNLQLDKLTILKIHNATYEQINHTLVRDCLLELKNEGFVDSIGVSIYSISEFESALKQDWIDVIQFPYNILDQRLDLLLSNNLFDYNKRIISRSTYLKGIFTSRINNISSNMNNLIHEVDNIKSVLECNQSELRDIAIRFCCSNKYISDVLIGVSSVSELTQSIQSTKKGKLSNTTLHKIKKLSNLNNEIIDPRTWTGL